MTTTESVSHPQSKGGKVLSIIGLILGLLGLFTCGLTSLVGLILSIIGFVKNKSGLAIAGIVISILMLIAGPVINIVLFSWLASEGRKIQERERTEALSQRADAISQNQPFTNDYQMKMVYLEPGTFTMGSPVDEKDRDDDEIQHRVTLSKGFYMQSTEVTQGQWKAVMGTTPWRGQEHSKYVKEGDQYPAVYVSWEDAVAFCKKLSQLTGKTYRLPTEAEWEYAARAGSTTAYSFGDDISELKDYGWYGLGLEEDKTNIYAREVGTKLSNQWGLYDMHGNVGELCIDWYGAYHNNAVTDPKGAKTGPARVLRGGNFLAWEICRSASRDRIKPSIRAFAIGFRVVMEND